MNTSYSAGNVTLAFAHLSQEVINTGVFDTSRFSKDAGMDISGFIGETLLSQLTAHIGYRDALVKLDYDPKHTNDTLHLH